MKRSALCLVDTEAQADAVVAKLRSAGFSDNDISVLFPDKASTRDFAHKKETKMPEGATVGASTGGVVGGTIGLLAGTGALAIPGLGPFIAAGPIILKAEMTGVETAQATQHQTNPIAPRWTFRVRTH